jgi:hypothetical protein
MSSWPSGVKKAQEDTEWAVFDAESVFDVLPQCVQTAFQAQFTTTRQEVITADQAFVAAVTAALAAGNQNWTVALVSLVQAATDLTNLVVQITEGNPPLPDGGVCISPAITTGTASQDLNDMQQRLADLKSQH